MLQNYPVAGIKLGWVAIQHGAGSKEGSINVLDLITGSNRTLTMNGRPGFFAETTKPGVVVVGLEHKLVCFDLVTGTLGQTIAQIDPNPEVIINDGLAVEGGLLFGTKHLAFSRPIAGLYFYDLVTRRVHRILDKQICSNGKFLRRDPNGATLIDIDTTPKRISKYRLDTRLEKVLDAVLVKPVESLPALPDGLRPAPACLDALEGESAVVAFYNPEDAAAGLAQQIRLSDGEVIAEWVIPLAPRVTCPEFVKMDGEVKLVFTTAVEGMSDEARTRAPGSGGLYIADTAFENVPEPPPLISI